MSQNIVIVTGNLGADPVVGESNGVTYGRFSIAVNAVSKDKEGKVHKRTDWFQVSAFDKLAETLTALSRGDHVLVRGSLRTGSYQRDDQPAVKTVEIRAQAIEFLNLKARSEEPAEDQADSAESPEDAPDAPDASQRRARGRRREAAA